MIVQLVFRDKELAPYVTRVAVKEMPKTIVYNDAVFQNATIIRSGARLVYQYREIPAVHISSIELCTAISLKVSPGLCEPEKA